MKRRTQAQRTEENRAAVLAVAREHFGTRGYHGATVEAIAEAAGFSKGVVYSRFGSKDDLFLAVLEASIDARRQAILDGLADLRAPDDVRQVVERISAQDDATVAWQAALVEFRVHAWRQPTVNARYAELHERTVDNVADAVTALYARSGTTPPDPARVLARGLLASGSGLLLEKLADPTSDASRTFEALGAFMSAIDSTPETTP